LTVATPYGPGGQGGQAAGFVPIPGGQQLIKSWWVEANGEKITGKIPIEAKYCLTTYKSKYFPLHTELSRDYAGATNKGSVNPRGYNLLVYTFGIDGARDAVGTGNVNFDALSSVILHLDFNGSGAGASIGVLAANGQSGTYLANNSSQGFYAPPIAAGGSDFNNYYCAVEPMVVDTYSFTANFTTLENGNWTRQLAQ
jgi:hypothetical protein